MKNAILPLCNYTLEGKAWSALRAYKKGSADFSDYCIGLMNRRNGVSKTVTFDRKAAKHELFTLLK
jgi:predicted nucleic-acid-binding protein